MTLSDIQTLFHCHARGVGHTTAAVKVALGCDGLLLVVNQSQVYDLKRQHPELCVGVIDRPERMLGKRQPIIIDHNALDYLFSEVDREIRRVVEENTKLREDIASLKERKP